MPYVSNPGALAAAPPASAGQPRARLLLFRGAMSAQDLAPGVGQAARTLTLTLTLTLALTLTLTRTRTRTLILALTLALTLTPTPSLVGQAIRGAMQRLRPGAARPGAARPGAAASNDTLVEEVRREMQGRCRGDTGEI